MTKKPIKIVIISAAGFAEEVLFTIQECNKKSSKYEILGFIDDNTSLHGKKIKTFSSDDRGEIIDIFSKEPKYAFLKRDDIIAALSNAVVVVETRSKGGAKYTANVARKKKIPVIVPKINNNDPELQDGFEVLVQEGAHVAKDEDDVIEIIKSLPKSDNQQLDSFL